MAAYDAKEKLAPRQRGSLLAASCACFALVMMLVVTFLQIGIGYTLLRQFSRSNRSKTTDEYMSAMHKWEDGKVDGWSTNARNWTYELRGSCGGEAGGPLRRQMRRGEDWGRGGRPEGGSYRVVYYEDPRPAAAARVQFSETAEEPPPCEMEVTVFHTGSRVLSFGMRNQWVESRSFADTGCSTEGGGGEKWSGQFPAVDVCRKTCRDAGGVPHGSTPENFACRYQVVPAQLCVRVTHEQERWQEATGRVPAHGSFDPSSALGAGCYLDPAAPHRWSRVRTRPLPAGDSRIPVPLIVRHEADPYLHFLDLTQGTKVISTGHMWKLMTAVALLIFSVAPIAFFCCALGNILRYAHGNNTGLGPEPPDRGFTLGLFAIAARCGHCFPGGASLREVPRPLSSSGVDGLADGKRGSSTELLNGRERTSSAGALAVELAERTVSNGSATADPFGLSPAGAFRRVSNNGTSVAATDRQDSVNMPVMRSRSQSRSGALV